MTERAVIEHQCQEAVAADVQNMTCSVRPITVEKELQKVPGGTDAKIDVAAKTATVKFDPDKASPAIPVKATADASYPATPHK